LLPPFIPGVARSVDGASRGRSAPCEAIHGQLATGDNSVMNGLPAGLRIGHATDAAARTGCTVFLGPFRAASFVAGHATGTRQLDVLSTLHIVPRIDALLFTGGSAFGLGAASGVVDWLEERGEGFDVGAARVPIVPAAVIFDLAVASRRPDAAMARAACEAARPDAPAEGAVGVGAGATVGKWLGPANASRGGFGCSASSYGTWSIFTAVVVNALGDILGADGQVIAGARTVDGTFAGPAMLHTGPANASMQWPSSTNTTLAAVATDAPLTRTQLEILARMTTAALARRISPAFTPFDGDIVFTLSTVLDGGGIEARELLALGSSACRVLEHSIGRAVA
jgi:L-aminopeptidase/D-esterase-like protein